MLTNNSRFDTKSIVNYVFDNYIKPYYKNKRIDCINIEKLNVNNAFVDGIINDIRFIINFNNPYELNKFIKYYNA